MSSASGLTAVLKRERLLVLGGLCGLTLLAWVYMIHEARVMSLTGVCSCAGMKMSRPDMTSWPVESLVPLFLMWTVMMVAMMLPSAAPMILTFALVNRKRRERQEIFVPVGIFLAGYLLVWIAFSVLAALAQWGLHATALLSPMMISTSPILGGGLLILAGLFQWTPIKNVCLTHCRSPLTFLMADWQEGRVGALRMGLKHGAFCAGCCWCLMALLFVAGVMNMWWVAAIAGLVLVEKLAPKGLWFGRLAGLLLLGWGVWMFARRGN